ncbi:hypothetical protein TNCV_4416321 [Trichonephila clavipes]|uniref:Uncharacterized protein n=1 Tax=Trichonephila clavipes TaxID=2585209 RepID=A0A8X6RZ96_TRICX|nr:hypothetical protein TNCV_4416321 [Trichonephila clavipes]
MPKELPALKHCNVSSLAELTPSIHVKIDVYRVCILSNENKSTKNNLLEISLQNFSSLQNMLFEQEQTSAGDVSTLPESHQPKHPSEHACKPF